MWVSVDDYVGVCYLCEYLVEYYYCVGVESYFSGDDVIGFYWVMVGNSGGYGSYGIGDC